MRDEHGILSKGYEPEGKYEDFMRRRARPMVWARTPMICTGRILVHATPHLDDS